MHGHYAPSFEHVYHQLRDAQSCQIADWRAHFVEHHRCDHVLESLAGDVLVKLRNDSLRQDIVDAPLSQKFLQVECAYICVYGIDGL